MVYINDTRLDDDGNPVIFYVTAALYQPGPPGEPRYQTVARWDGREWYFSQVTPPPTPTTWARSTSRTASGASSPPPSRGPSRGAVAERWPSGEARTAAPTWVKERDVTRNSPLNHHYVRPPLDAHPDFYAFWADGNPDAFWPSHLYFANRDGSRVWRLPYDMQDEFARPEALGPPAR